jgi:hypothetical protein
VTRSAIARDALIFAAGAFVKYLVLPSEGAPMGRGVGGCATFDGLWQTERSIVDRDNTAGEEGAGPAKQCPHGARGSSPQDVPRHGHVDQKTVRDGRRTSQEISASYTTWLSG